MRADPKALAAMRIAIAICVLIDLAQRLLDIPALYADSGILPRIEFLDAFADPIRAGSLALAGGTLASQLVLFGACGLASLCLLFGWGARLASLISWLSLTAIHNRHPAATFASDGLLRDLLFWGALLPWGASWSIRRSEPPAASEGRPRDHDLIPLALMVLIAALFIASGVIKATSDWPSGAGLTDLLDHELITRPLGRWLADLTSLHSSASAFVILVQVLGGIVLLSPWGAAYARTVAVALLGSILLVEALAFSVGSYPYAAAAALLMFLPGSAWQAVDRFLARSGPAQRAFDLAISKARAIAARFPTGPFGPAGLHRHWPAIRIGVAFLALLHLGWSIPGPGADVAGVDAGWLSAAEEMPVTQTRWGVVDPAARTGWFRMPGVLNGGDDVDLFAAGGPLPDLTQALTAAGLTTPESISSAMFAGPVWQAFFLSNSASPNQPMLQSYGRYLCRSWNSRHDWREQLNRFEIVFHSRPVASNARPHVAAEYQPQILWRHWCAGAPAA